MSQPIPDRIERELKGTLDDLWIIHRIIADTKESLDDRMGGNGRYEADCWLNRAADIASRIAYVERFREIAATKDIDAQAAIERLGGIPDLCISKAAQAWMDNTGGYGPCAQRFPKHTGD